MDKIPSLLQYKSVLNGKGICFFLNIKPVFLNILFTIVIIINDCEL